MQSSKRATSPSRPPKLFRHSLANKLSNIHTTSNKTSATSSKPASTSVTTLSTSSSSDSLHAGRQRKIPSIKTLPRDSGTSLPSSHAMEQTTSHTSQPSTKPPTLTTILADQAAPPYNLASFRAYLTRKYATENLSFYEEASKYATKYADYVHARTHLSEAETAAKRQDAVQQWANIVSWFLASRAPSALNVDSTVKRAVVDVALDPANPPEPSNLRQLNAAARDNLQSALLEFNLAVNKGEVYGTPIRMRAGSSQQHLSQHHPSSSAATSSPSPSQSRASPSSGAGSPEPRQRSPSALRKLANKFGMGKKHGPS